MPRLTDVTLKAMALTGSPATRRPIHAMKSAKEQPMPNGPEEHDAADALLPPSAEVLKALSEVKLAKASNDAGVREAAEAIGHLLAAHKSLTLEDVINVAKATGLEAVAKADSEDEDEDEDKEWEDDEEEMTEEERKKKEAAKELAKSETANPWAEAAPMSKESDKASRVAKSDSELREEIKKSYEVRLAKAENMLAEERDYRMTNLIKSEVVSTFKNLGVEHDKLATIIKSARSQKDQSLAENLMTILKAADAQVGLARQSGGNAYSTLGKSTQFSANELAATGMGKINAYVDSIIQKGETKKSRPQLVDELMQTAQGREWAAEHSNDQSGAY